MRVSSLVIPLIVYAAGIARVWRSAGYGRGVRPLEALAFVAGWLAMAVALSPPMDELSETWLTAHMLQHELLMVVAAPLVASSAPLMALLWAVPLGIRRRALDLVRGPRMIGAWSLATAPIAVFLLHAIALWVVASPQPLRVRPWPTRASICSSTPASSAPPPCSGGASRMDGTAGPVTARRSSTCSQPYCTPACSVPC